jgi:sigma-B regulation protein RsbU (phosphoserine phosphatase)
MTTALFDNSPSGYFSFFDDGTVNVVNQTLCGLLHYSKADLEGKSVERIFTLPTRIFFQTHLFPLLKMQGHAGEIFLSLLSKEGEHLPVLLNAKREEAETPSTACAFIVVATRKKFEDELVAARKQAETALRENTALAGAKAELQERAEELDAQIHRVNAQNNELKQLNHVITHSLKEPLRKMLVYTGKLQGQMLPVSVSEDLARLNRSSVQLRNIVTSLQQYVWLGDAPLKLATIQLENIIKPAAEKVEKELGTGRLSLQVGLLPSIEADAEQLELLFYHLFANAVQFRKEESARVTISASILQQNSFRNVKDKYQYDDFVRLTVRDEGIGFEPAFSDAVFELFKKIHPTDGTGLGLALCKKITANHFGFIKADSEPNVGTTVTIMLPVIHSLPGRRQADAESV